MAIRIALELFSRELNLAAVSPFQLERSPRGPVVFSVLGPWTKAFLGGFERIESTLIGIEQESVTFDFSGCTRIDSAGAVALIRLRGALEANRCPVDFRGIQPDHEKLLSFYARHFRRKPFEVLSTLSRGRRIVQASGEILFGAASFFSFLGETVSRAAKLVLTPWRFRWTALVRHIHVSAIQALPIVMMLSFLIGLVVAYQSAGYLSKVSGDVFVVDLSVMSVFRELSPMITAILMAARSASSFTAEIGTMKITEEIDAMKTMGFDPITFLVLPRIAALVLAMPLLIFAADFAGMAGTMIVAYFHLGIGFHEFIERMFQEVSVNELYVGLGKSPVYGAIVATVGCYRGFQVSGSTESIGAYTTKSAVSAIFWVIICDALIAVALTRLGI